jgi:hypothetical protein
MALDEKACREAGNVFRILFNSWVRVPATAFAFLSNYIEISCKSICANGFAASCAASW